MITKVTLCPIYMDCDKFYSIAYTCLYLNKYLMYIWGGGGVLIEGTVSHPVPFDISPSIPMVVDVVGNFS